MENAISNLSQIPRPGKFLAAIDLGSNSFHLLLARLKDSEAEVVARHRDPVRMGGGIGEDGNFTPEAMERGLQAIESMAEIIRSLPAPCEVRAVGTHAFRIAGNSELFLQQAGQVLGETIQVISGTREAELIYSGIHSSRKSAEDSQLVVDIGGGSTEIIVGKRGRAVTVASVPVGCVGITRKYFPDACANPESVQAAKAAIRNELEPVIHSFAGSAWQVVLGASGIIRTIHQLCRSGANARKAMTFEDLHRLETELLAADSFLDLTRRGISVDRAQVLCGGLCVLRSIFDVFGITEMEAVDAALQEGLMQELVDETKAELLD